ncbi:hypothetical protein [Bacillus cereus]|uniref:hypothetical protein n=1 Tax=Bacillus cereus TaxID=1396 RepID=UPI001C8B3F88|nr:hypothetical protein [Bacillus cereus]MBX9158625.1 hypothetical protein [Bacillus cereus]
MAGVPDFVFSLGITFERNEVVVIKLLDAHIDCYYDDEGYGFHIDIAPYECAREDYNPSDREKVVNVKTIDKTVKEAIGVDIFK